MTFAYRGFQRLFFTYLELVSSRQNRDSEAQSGAFSNGEHGLFHPKYFDPSGARVMIAVKVTQNLSISQF